MGPDAEGRRCPQRRGRGARPVRLGSRPGPVWSARRASPAVMRRPRELWAQGRMGPPRWGGQRRGGGSLRLGGSPRPLPWPGSAPFWRLCAPPPAGRARPPPPPAPRVSWSARCWGAGGPAPSPASLGTPTVGGAAGRCPRSRSRLRRPLRLLGRERKKIFFQSNLLEF